MGTKDKVVALKLVLAEYLNKKTRSSQYLAASCFLAIFFYEKHFCKVILFFCIECYGAFDN